MERQGENICKVSYIFEADMKGSIPNFIKRQVTKNQGEVAGRINGFLR